MGAPGAGKSTLRASLFAAMKIAGYNVEEVTEYAKDMVWEERQNIFADQLYILAKQNRRLLRLQGKVDYVITDSPLIMNIAYHNDAVPYNDTLAQLTVEMFKMYDNINIFLNRTHTYQELGRNQNEAEAEVISEKIKGILRNNGIAFEEVDSDKFNFADLMQLLGLPVNNERHDNELLEKLFWEFDAESKRDGSQRLFFKDKLRWYANHFLAKFGK